MTAWCRWLGVAGVEISLEDQILIIDPYFTRLPIWKMWIGPVHPDHDLLTENIPHCDAILVTHPHFDHLMDVPTVANHTRAMVIGSTNTCKIAIASGVPQEQVRRIDAGDQLDLDTFHVDVLPAQHGKTGADKHIDGPVSDGLKPPLRALDYRMDQCFSFLVEVAGIRVLVGSGEPLGDSIPADVLFVGPLLLAKEARRYYLSLIQRVRPKIIIPYHWDDFFRPLSKPIRPSLRPPSLTIPPLQRIDLGGVSRLIKDVAPQAKVIIPEIFHRYPIDELL
jgi:L-ascorbate metabolism protein UlaG (beta-lactamase superfamily)